MRSLMTLVPLLVAVGLLIAVGTSSLSFPDLSSNESSRDAEEEAIRALLRQLQEDWQRRDVAAFTAHFTKDANLMDSRGPWVRHRSEIKNYLTRALEQDSRDHAEAGDARVLFDAVQILSPEIALVHQQRSGDSRKAIATYVLAKQGGRWWVQSLDITPIDPADSRGPHG